MKILTPAQKRDFAPVCPSAPWRPFAAFLLVTVAALALLTRGVSGTALPTVLLAMAVLTTMLAGAGPAVLLARTRALTGAWRLTRQAVPA